MDKIKWILNHMPKSGDQWISVMEPDIVDQARAFHGSFPQYSVTPLAILRNRADAFGVGALCVKDESYRFGLNAFKVLGSSFAMARRIARETGRPLGDITYSYLTGPEAKRELGRMTFFTATDGNHGRGVAWAARMLGQRAVVRMPKGTRQSRLDNIRREGAEVTIEEGNYDDCVRLAAAQADQCGNGVVIQDTAWEGYTQIPSWIMQGYGTMASEAVGQMEKQGIGKPTHVIVQAGVGSLAGAVIGYYSLLFKDDPPKFIVAEASAADCFYRSAAAGDGTPRFVGGDLNTIMAGLACGEPNPIAWDILRNHADVFVSCPDRVTKLGMRLLAAPEGGDPRVVSGESGAVGMGLMACMATEELRGFREEIGLDENSRVLLFSTEGDTDPERYREITGLCVR